MRIFELSKEYSVVCNSQKTKYGFRHTASLCKNGSEVGKTKCCYYNRTWEAFEYQSVLKKVIHGYFTGAEEKRFLEIAERGKEQGGGALRSASMIAALGDILCDKKEKRNAWKKRFLDKVPGIDFPTDFDSLSEKEKQRRLNGAIKISLKEKKRILLRRSGKGC